MKREWRAATLAKLGVTGVRPAVVADSGIHFVRSQLSGTLLAALRARLKLESSRRI
ncbi:hypothetical protein QUB56_12600 [Microcoleus sp. AR_TQ3_B6]|uniref:hypothetical protein n=1 Tax=Microcoleus sp. AR_TQ3_B6 TaxID=3055284 RepID=UPI002FD41C67